MARFDDWRDVLEAVPALVWTTCPKGELEWCGSAARSWFADSQRWLDAVHPDEREACIGAWHDSLVSLRAYRSRHRLRDDKGGFVQFACEARAVRDRDDVVTRWVWTATDISETVTLRDELDRARAHRQRVETALADAKVGIWIHDLKKNVLVHSRVDGERDPIKCIQRGMIASESTRVLDAYRRALSDPTYRYNVEFRALEPYGEHWRLARGKLLFGPDGTAEWFVGASVDVSAVRRTEAAHRRISEQLELATKLSGVYIWAFELENGAIGPARASFVNVWESLGYEQPEEIDFATAMAKVILEEDQLAVAQAVAACIDGSAPSFQQEYRIRHADGAIRWNLGRGIVARDEEGRPLRFIGTSVDITDLKTIQTELALHKRRLELALNGSRACTWEFEPKDGVLKDGTSWFANLVELVGHERSPTDDFMSLHERIIPEADQDAFLERVQRFLDGTESHYEDLVRVRHRDGGEHWHLARGVCTRDPETGRAIRLTGTSVDVTEQKRMEAAAEAANREKDVFLSHVSHELRTPMNAILAMTELALEKPQSEHQAQLLSTVQSAAGNLVGIIDDLLDFAKITAGKLSLDLSELSLRTMILDTVRANFSRAERKGIAVSCDIAPNVPDFVLADEQRLRQVLMNLLGNAVKFTSQGNVALRVSAVDVVPPGLALSFAVQDTGIGISAEHQRQIFDPFMQGDASTTRKYGGTGLGLTISSQLVELMGGVLSVESEIGRGSTFSFTICLGRCADRIDLIDHTTDSAPPVPLAPRGAIAPRVLVAEDNELNVAVLRELLDQRGYAADFARDGREAWELVRADVHDLLLLDLHMPEMDGFEVVRAIRSHEEARGVHLPIIALTARSSARDRELALAAGMDDFLSKPIKVNALWSAIDRALEKFPPSPERARAKKLVDRSAVLRVSGGRPAVFERLRDVFRESLPAQMVRGLAALADRDFGRLLDAAHRLHGTLSTFSSVAGAVALRLEDAAREKELVRCQELVATLEAMCATLLDETCELAFEDMRH